MYDALDRFNRLIISRWVKNPSGPGADRYKVTLSYDRNSNITEIDDAVQSAPGMDWQYTYDDLDRLTRARAGTLSSGSITSETRDQNWTLDHAGNWGHTTFDLNADDVYTGGGEYDWDFTQNKANEITGWDNQSPGGNVAPVYDAAGNMTDAKRDWQYEYDAWYRLVRVRAQNGSGGDIVAEFKYNGLGHRISARYPSGGETAPWRHFAYDERWRMVAMYEDDAATDVPTEQFWHHNAGPSGFGGSSYIDDVVLRDRMTGAGGEGVLDERLYYLQNWHHDVVALVDTSGAIVERANYDGYGMPIGTFSSGGNGNRRGYAGYEIDPELAGHWHVRHRVLRSDLGVWTRRDPLGYVDGGRLYGYARGKPIGARDPLGTFSEGTADPCRTCNQGLRIAQTGQRYRERYEYILGWISLRCGSCSGMQPQCVHPNDRNNPGWETCSRYSPKGFADCPAWNGRTGCPQAFLCCNNRITDDDFAETAVEELIHAFDCCYFGQHWDLPGIQPTDLACARCVCSEIRAAIGTFECGPNPTKNCLKGEARKSCKTTDPNKPHACSAQQFDQVFDLIWEHCRDLLPQPWTPPTMLPDEPGNEHPDQRRLVGTHL